MVVVVGGRWVGSGCLRAMLVVGLWLVVGPKITIAKEKRLSQRVAAQ